MAGSPERVKFIGFPNPALKPLTGKTLAEVAKLRGTIAEDTRRPGDRGRLARGHDLFPDERGQRRARADAALGQFGSDAEAQAPEGVFLKSSTHPRAYGNFARLLGQIRRATQLMPLEQAIRGSPACRRRTGNCGIAAASTWTATPTWWCSIRPPSPITRPSTRRSSTPSACAHVRGQRRAGDAEGRTHRRHARTRGARAGLSALRPGCGFGGGRCIAHRGLTFQLKRQVDLSNTFVTYRLPGDLRRIVHLDLSRSRHCLAETANIISPYDEIQYLPCPRKLVQPRPTPSSRRWAARHA